MKKSKPAKRNIEVKNSFEKMQEEKMEKKAMKKSPKKAVQEIKKIHKKAGY